MQTRFSLINAGLYPETLPPCFVSSDSKRAFWGLVTRLDEAQFHEHKTDYVRYNSTKHDGNRRYFGTPNIITYFHVASYLWRHWDDIEKNYNLSSYSIGTPKIMEDGSERAVKVPSLSELSKHTSANLKYAPFILKADISQCFPSIYTHSIPWAAHGVEESKEDTNKDSKHNKFNALDFFVRNGQRGNTRGILIGPDAYRLIAEFILSKIDHELEKVVGQLIVGAARHVDDYYIGLQTEHDAQSVLSHLREVLAGYALNLNDHKTKIYSSLEPINDLWAQRLRDHTNLPSSHLSYERIERSISEAVDAAKLAGSDSPIKILLRSFDEARVYQWDYWSYIEQNLQRIVQKHPHAIDYACLLVAKRKAIGEPVDNLGWSKVAEAIIKRGLALSHDHEVLWMAWLLIVIEAGISPSIIEELAKSRNSHIRAFLVQAQMDGRLCRNLRLSLGSGLQTMDNSWLVNLVARSQGFSKASFSGNYANYFEHLAKKNIRLLDFDAHKKVVAQSNSRAISRTRYGYDDESNDMDDFENNFDHFDDNEY